MDEQDIILTTEKGQCKTWRIPLIVRSSLNKDGSSLTLFASNIKAKRYCLERIIRESFREKLVSQIRMQTVQ